MTMTWILLHPDATPEHLGSLPSFLNDDDPADARAQFNANYVFGGWRPFGGERVKIGRGLALEYPGDPLIEPIAMCKLRDELILVYEGDWVAVLQKDGSFEVARMD